MNDEQLIVVGTGIRATGQLTIETIAWMQAEGGYISLNSMLEKMRDQAAELGASGLYVLQTQRSEMKEFGGSAKAIRCLPT